MRKLVIAAKAKTAERDSREQRKALDNRFPPVPYEMDDGRVITFRMVDPSDLILLLGTLQEVGVHDEGGRLVARDQGAAIEAGLGLVALLRRMLSEADHAYLMRRVRAFKDPLDMEIVMGIVVEIMQEEWTDRPSEPSSPSSPSRAHAGKRSTETSQHEGSTPSTSDSTGS